MTGKENQMSAEEKDQMRKIQLSLLNSNVRNLYVAAGARNTEKYGKHGSAIAKTSFVQSLLGDDPYIAQLLKQPYLNDLQKEQSDEDFWNSASTASRLELLKNAQEAYESALTKIKVGDVLEMLQIENVHAKQISSKQKEMYMEDFKEANEEMYKILTEKYLNTVQKQGIGQSMIAQSSQGVKGLEKILQTDPAELQNMQEQYDVAA